MSRKFLGISIEDWIIGALFCIAGYGIWWGLFRPLMS